MTFIDGTLLIRKRPIIAVVAFVAALHVAAGNERRAARCLHDLEFFARLRMLALPVQMRGAS